VTYTQSRVERSSVGTTEGVKRRGREWTEDLAFLAMAHQALGRAKPAREWLGRFEARFTQSSLQWNFWQQISRENLLAEARAKIVFDPVFPADPFAGR
jgi:hypothetical protein